ncbi:undecaprenyl-diphosphate phosphatase [Eremococcus coleocola]|uniref:Undecaprenyl-diphosphatase n=1 Tax=Eremococcus coleocola ACS-139-V-Col8 TaxID=908337 RepID=E4KP91_9LACT|nr:undecaprenyl-diphosphate phosphatase [Eremococcus coleocola]EFR30960.1 undecaprenyl-diphosphatase UppP [Eremococcus coleocola ACS-139-V-Col8]
MLQAIDLIELLKLFIISVVQGITEWLPISSTGHMILIEDFMPLNLSAEFRETFLILVQLGSIMAVVVLYFHKLNPLSPSKNYQERKETWTLWFKVIVASIPVLIFGLFLNDYMDTYFYNPTVVAIALIVYGFAFIWIEKSNHAKHSAKTEHLEDLSYNKAFKIGLFQSLAIIPGTSRSGSTIMGGLLTNNSRFVATEFSFFLGIPVMFGASFLKLLKLGFSLSQVEIFYLIFSMVVAFIVSIVVIRFLLTYLKRNDFTGFGYYRIALGAIVILYNLLIK